MDNDVVISTHCMEWIDRFLDNFVANPMFNQHKLNEEKSKNKQKQNPINKIHFELCLLEMLFICSFLSPIDQIDYGNIRTYNQ